MRGTELRATRLLSIIFATTRKQHQMRFEIRSLCVFAQCTGIGCVSETVGERVGVCVCQVLICGAIRSMTFMSTGAPMRNRRLRRRTQFPPRFAKFAWPIIALGHRSVYRTLHRQIAQTSTKHRGTVQASLACRHCASYFSKTIVVSSSFGDVWVFYIYIYIYI